MEPNNLQALTLRIRLLQRAGEQSAALELADKAIALSPEWDGPYLLVESASFTFAITAKPAIHWQKLSNSITNWPEGTSCMESFSLVRKKSLRRNKRCDEPFLYSPKMPASVAI